MESKKLRLKIATPERVVYEAQVDSVSCPTEMGEVTILPGHIPLVANIYPGEIKAILDGKTKSIAVLGGFLEVRIGNEIAVLADAAEHVEEIDLSRAEEARDRAKKVMSQQIMGEEEYAATAAALERSLARLRLSRKHKYRDVGKTP